MNASTQFPVSLKDFLRIAIGGKYEYDRERIYRAFIRARFLGRMFPPAAMWLRDALQTKLDRDVGDYMAHRREVGFGGDEFEAGVKDVQNWLPGYRKELRQSKASKAAKARWRKNVKKTS